MNFRRLNALTFAAANQTTRHSCVSQQSADAPHFLGAALANLLLFSCPAKRDYLSSSAQGVEVVRPSLHHLAAVRESSCAVVNGPNLVPLSVRQLQLDQIRMQSLFVEARRGRIVNERLLQCTSADKGLEKGLVQGQRAATRIMALPEKGQTARASEKGTRRHRIVGCGNWSPSPKLQACVRHACHIANMKLCLWNRHGHGPTTLT
jgi:hypothetical protein